MAKEKSKVGVKAVLKLEKYPEGTKEEDIKNGKAKPEETVVSEDNFELNKED